MWRDASGRSLTDYPQPSVAVDVVLLTVLDATLRVVVHRRAGGYAAGRLALPGTFVHVDETLADAALRALRDVLGVTGRRPRQLGVFDALDRDARGRVLAVAHLDVVPPGLLDLAFAGGPAELVPARRGPSLAFDHDAMVAAAVRALRAEHAGHADPRGLLGAQFTLAELQRLHEAVAGGPLAKDTFRRHVQGDLEPTGERRTGTVGKPARLFRHAGPRPGEA